MSKITFHKITFSNMFSYGENNTLELDKNKITQLTAINGSGKSSIALILQELLFNKNIKGIKKGDILNRYSKVSGWAGSVSFTIDSDTYNIAVERVGAKSTVKLYKNKEDLTEHKVLDTYKNLQDILGLNFETFSQLTYQSSTDLLEFLKATDTNRKKFLISLFNLEKYVKIGEVIKLKTNSFEKDLLKLQGEINSINSFLDNTTIEEKQELLDIPTIDESKIVRITTLKKEIEEYQETCKLIDKNNLRIQELSGISYDIILQKPIDQDYFNKYKEEKYKFDSGKNKISDLEKEYKSIDDKDVCDSCGQKIDNKHAKQIKINILQKIDRIKQDLNELELNSVKAHNNYKIYQEQLEKYEENQKAMQRCEHLIQLIDDSLPKEYPNLDNIELELESLTKKYKEEKESIQKAQKYNENVSKHNAKVEALQEQKIEFLNRQSTINNDIVTLTNKVNNLNILKKAFSTTGIVAFKLENLTKELENKVNYYLSLLSDGQFQIFFRLDKEKLNIIVSNNGAEAPIETVSSGEFSRIQTAILLAIRNLLSKLGGNSINLLFLDEITGVLDDEGKEKLIEVLRDEENLNVFLISHDFTHPLIDKLSIVKNNNISSIQN